MREAFGQPMSCRALNFLDGMTGRLRTRSLYTEEYRYNVAELYCTASKQASRTVGKEDFLTKLYRLCL